MLESSVAYVFTMSIYVFTMSIVNVTVIDANSVGLDWAAPIGAVRYGFILF